MKNFPFKRIVSLSVLFSFLFSDFALAAPSNNKSFFQNKKPNYQRIIEQNEALLNKKKAIHRGEDIDGRVDKRTKEAQRVLSSHLQDLSQLHIPQEIGRVIEVYDAKETRNQSTETRLIVLIQDLHTNPEAELNLAKILEILLKDYNLGLVCSEGADEEVDTSSVSSFPDAQVREKVAKLFVNSGELTGEEYLSITKYPDLPIWGIENRDLYFKNIIEFNKIMKFNPSSQLFISQVKKSLEELKPKIYSKELLEIDAKQTEYEKAQLGADKYLDYLLSSRPGLEMSNFKNIALLRESLELEKNIDQQRITQESQNLLLNLQAELSKKALHSEIDSLMAKIELFKNQKLSPFSFYTYLKDLAVKYHLIEIASSPLTSSMSRAPRNDDTGVIASPTPSVIARSPSSVIARHEVPKQSQSRLGINSATKQSQYPHFLDFIDYLTKVNSLDSTKLFTEMEELTFEIKQQLAKNDEQKSLTQALRNIKFLEGFFNLKVSNEELDYFLNNKDSHKVGYFKEVITELEGGRSKVEGYIDYNPALIDEKLNILEDFYETVKQRDIAMFNNTISEVNKRNSKLTALIHGGFHTKGITRLLRDNNFSYIVISPYSKTDIDEENYHFLLSGKRKPLEEIMKGFDFSETIKELNASLRVPLVCDTDIATAWNNASDLVNEVGRIEDVLPKMWNVLVVARPKEVNRWNPQKNPIVDMVVKRNPKTGDNFFAIRGKWQRETRFFELSSDGQFREVENRDFYAQGAKEVFRKGKGVGIAPAVIAGASDQAQAAIAELKELIENALAQAETLLGQSPDLSTLEGVIHDNISVCHGVLMQLKYYEEKYGWELGHEQLFARWQKAQKKMNRQIKVLLGAKGSPLRLLGFILHLRDEKGITEITKKELIKEYRIAFGQKIGFSERTIDREIKSLRLLGIIGDERWKIRLTEAYKDITADDADRMNQAVAHVIKGGLNRWTLDDLEKEVIDAIIEAISRLTFRGAAKAGASAYQFDLDNVMATGLLDLSRLPSELIDPNDLLVTSIRVSMYNEMIRLGVPQDRAIEIAKGVIRSEFDEDREIMAAADLVEGADEYGVGLKIGGTTFKSSLVTEQGDLVNKGDSKLWTGVSGGKDATSLTAEEIAHYIVAEIIERIETSHNLKSQKQISVGISMPGQTENEEGGWGRIAGFGSKTPNMNFYNTEFADMLERGLTKRGYNNVKVFLINNSFAALLGEISAKGTLGRFGFRSGMSVISGTGVNASMAKDGKIVTDGGALRELGNVVLAPIPFRPLEDGFTNNAYNWRGRFPPDEELNKEGFQRFEVLINGDGLSLLANLFGFSIPGHPADLPDATNAAIEGDERALKLIELYGLVVGKGLAAIVAKNNGYEAKWANHTVLVSGVFENFARGVGVPQVASIQPFKWLTTAIDLNRAIYGALNEVAEKIIATQEKPDLSLLQAFTVSANDEGVVVSVGDKFQSPVTIPTDDLRVSPFLRSPVIVEMLLRGLIIRKLVSQGIISLDEAEAWDSLYQIIDNVKADLAVGGRARFRSLVAELTDRRQLELAVDTELEKLSKLSAVERVVWCGMGGSGVAGDVLKGMVEELGVSDDVEVIVVKEFEIPQYILDEDDGRNTLYILSSFSGTTAETLEMGQMLQAQGKNKIITMCSGQVADSPISRLAHDNNWPFVSIVERGQLNQPREAYVLTVAKVRRVLERILQTKALANEKVTMGPVLEKISEGWDRFEAESRRMATEIYNSGKIPVLIVDDSALSMAIATRIKQQFAECPFMPVLVFTSEEAQALDWSSYPNKFYFCSLSQIPVSGLPQMDADLYAQVAELLGRPKKEGLTITDMVYGVEALFGTLVAYNMSVLRGIEPMIVPLITGDGKTVMPYYKAKETNAVTDFDAAYNQGEFLIVDDNKVLQLAQEGKAINIITTTEQLAMAEELQARVRGQGRVAIISVIPEANHNENNFWPRYWGYGTTADDMAYVLVDEGLSAPEWWKRTAIYFLHPSGVMLYRPYTYLAQAISEAVRELEQSKRVGQEDLQQQIRKRLDELVAMAAEITRLTYDRLAERYRDLRAPSPEGKDIEMIQQFLRRARQSAVPGEPVKVLDIGTGLRDFTYFSEQEGVSVVGIDISNGVVGLIRSRVETPGAILQMDMSNLGFGNETFDGVRSNATLHHLLLIDSQQGADIAVQEAYRVLKPGGVFYVLVKAETDERRGFMVVDTGERLGPRFYQFYSKESLRELLERNGFTVLGNIEEWTDKRGEKNLLAFAQKTVTTPRELAKSSRRQPVDSMDQIIAVFAENIIKDEKGFEEWIAKQPENIAVVIIAMEDEYGSVKKYEDIAYIKVAGKDIKSDGYYEKLRELSTVYGKPEFFNGFKLGAPYTLDKYKSVIDEIASGV